MRQCIFILILCFTLHAKAELTTTDGFQAGTRLLQEQKYSEASQQFKSLYDSGKSFAALFYNWGLAEYSQKRIGLAVGLWRKALSEDAELQSAHSALAFAENELPRQAVDENQTLWGQFNLFVAERFTLNKVLFVCWLLFIFSGYLLFKYWGARKRAMQKELPLPSTPALGIVFLTFFLFFLLTAAVKTISLFEVRATISAQSVALKTSPNEESNSIFDLLEGLDVKVKRVQGTWALITLRSGVSGWVPTETIFQHSGKKRLW